MSELLNERQKTHGDFTFNANAAQKIKQVFLSMEHDKLSYVQAEALDMIASKISRILSGDPDFKDHWEDIIGYSTLALKDIEKRNPKQENMPLCNGLIYSSTKFDCNNINIKSTAKVPNSTTSLNDRLHKIDEKLSTHIKVMNGGYGYCKCGNHFSCCPQCG